MLYLILPTYRISGDSQLRPIPNVCWSKLNRIRELACSSTEPIKESVRGYVWKIEFSQKIYMRYSMSGPAYWKRSTLISEGARRVHDIWRYLSRERYASVYACNVSKHMKASEIFICEREHPAISCTNTLFFCDIIFWYSRKKWRK